MLSKALLIKRAYCSFQESCHHIYAPPPLHHQLNRQYFNLRNSDLKFKRNIEVAACDSLQIQRELKETAKEEKKKDHN
jgi:hypothetical protein